MSSKSKTKGRKWLARLRNTIIVLIILIGILVVVFNATTKLNPPVIEDMSVLELKRENPAPDYFKVGNCWLKKNNFGLWEMYLEGNPFEIGVINGKLTKELIKIQEDSFVDQINTMIPSKSYLRFLKYFIGWFNRSIDEYIPQEYIEEIYGVSFGASDGYEYIGNNYERMLNYHGAHDIGHALQSLALVGCTSFVTGMNSSDSSMIVGRNFDFYINESFAENKILAFVNPDNGYRFSYITWASMIGVVSGMNENGITVTINAAKSDIPTKAKMPISLLAREILQYAGNIDEAIAIAEKRETFVSESLLIGSGKEQTAVIIEKSPSRMDVFEPEAKAFVCSNHFQSNEFKDDPVNIEYIAESASNYRQKRCEQLITDTIDVSEAVSILRNYKGINDMNIGLGNEKAMAQFISHHGVVFQPELLNLWISTNYFQFGEFLGYNLNSVFNNAVYVTDTTFLYDTLEVIPSDPIISSSEYTGLIDFRTRRDIIKKHISGNIPIENEDAFIEDFINSNPEYYQGYVLAANYLYMNNKKDTALKFYQKAITKEFENSTTKAAVEQRIAELENKPK